MCVLSFLLVPSLSLLFQHEPLFSFSNSTCINRTSYATLVNKLRRDKGKCICLSITCLHHVEHGWNIEFLSQFSTLPILTDTVIGKHDCTGGAMPVVLTTCESLSQSRIVIVGNGYITTCSSRQDLDDYDTCTVRLSSSQILSRHPDYGSTGLRLDSLHNARPSFGPIG